MLYAPMQERTLPAMTRNTTSHQTRGFQRMLVSGMDLYQLGAFPGFQSRPLPRRSKRNIPSISYLLYFLSNKRRNLLITPSPPNAPSIRNQGGTCTAQGPPSPHSTCSSCGKTPNIPPSPVCVDGTSSASVKRIAHY